METQSHTPASSEKPEPYYGHRFPETDGDVTVMDRVSPYPPEFVNNIMREAITFCVSEGMTPDAILGSFAPALRPAAARILAQQGEVLRSEFRSEEEAEAFWAHVGEKSRCDFCHCVHEPDTPGFEGCAAELEAMYQPERHR